MKNRTQLILLLLCVTAALAFGGYQVFRASSRSPQAPVGPFTDRARLAEFSTNGVTVMVSLESDPQGQPLLRATFTPTNHEFHLYSKDPEAAGGIGLPTTLELLSHSSVKASGPVFADTSPQPHEFKALGVTLPIYPDGPVTLRLPIRFTGDSKEISVQVAVGFMACKTDGICLFPVKRQILDLKILPFQLPPTKIDQANRHPAFPFHARRPSRSAPIPHYAKTPPAYAGG